MSTFDLTFGQLAGLQQQGGAHVGVNFFEVDFAEALKLNPTMTAADILTIGKVPKGALLLGVSAETVEASQAGASDLTVQDDTGTPVVILDGHGIDTASEITGPKVGTTTFFGGGTAAGLHPVFLTAEKKINVLLGATAPTKGKLRVAVTLAKMAAF